ncbi:hypothetical protein PUR71_01235 [Streptomyces sp. SP17BM10]|uniref:hypothetical protein n=1 Tax=Streptomyces sp. SP17BM10 TaxID=3002530 RepID=UPI002E77A581|nr:hypothetical protein [Streptomyces sp. SP17BM10]MEE1781566.1 hypothetical protein [Streptomyces sp. SP17BM10]
MHERRPDPERLWEGRHVEESAHATGTKAKDDRTSMPAWLPDGATAVNYRMASTGCDRLPAATVPGARPPEGCTPGEPRGGVNPTAARLPGDTRARATARCGNDDAALVGDRLYAWQDHAVDLASLRSS